MLDGTATFPLALWERGQLCEQSEITTAGEGLIRCKEAKRQRCEVVIKNKFSCNFTKIAINENSPCHPVFCSSDSYPPQPSLIREGATHVAMLDNSCQFSPCHCEGVKRPWQSQNRGDNEILRFAQNDLAPVSVIADSEADPQSQDSCNMNEITTSNASHSPRNDIENAMQNPGVGCSGTLPRNDKFSSRFTLHPLLKKTYPPNVLSSYRLKKSAFTLAEVLITLGIIGVVAAMTIPTLMTKYQHKVRETEFKKAYSVLQQALYSIDPDMISAWTSNAGDRDTEFYTELYSKYRVITDEDVTDLYKDKKNQFAIKNYNKKEGAMNNCAQLPTRIAADGSAISGCYNCFASWLVIDTNGPKRAPNALGHDIFYFSFNKNKLVPVGSPDYSHWEMKPNSTYCSKNSTNVRNGASCAYFAVANICPDDSSKTYWECLP